MSALVLRHCVRCGQPFDVYSKTQRYCSRSCSNAAKPRGGAKARDPEKRFWKKVNKAGPVPAHCQELGPCWTWTAGTDHSGYGYFWLNGKMTLAHRVAWFLEFGAWPEPCALHKCDGGGIGCVRVHHMFEGTQADNVSDCIKKGRARRNPPRGEDNVGAKLTTANVLEIRAAVASGERQCECAKRFGVTRTLICNIISRKVWKHVA